MNSGNYERIIEKISRLSGVSKEELNKRVEEKRSKLSGLISKEGSAQVIASELGISFENELLKLNELLPGMRNVCVIGKIINIYPVRTFKTKTGTESKVVNFFIGDEFSNIKVVLWDTNHVELIEKGEIKEGDVVEIRNGNVRDSEIHLGSFSEIKKSNISLEKVVTERVFNEKKISDLVNGENASIRAFIVQIFEPRFFNVCPECGKKPESEGDYFVCAVHERIVPEKRAVLTLVIDDGTESIRCVLFHELLKEIGITNTQDADILFQQKNSLLGKEMFFSGSVRNNNFFNNSELVVSAVSEINIEKAIADLENK